MYTPLFQFAIMFENMIVGAVSSAFLAVMLHHEAFKTMTILNLFSLIHLSACIHDSQWLNTIFFDSFIDHFQSTSLIYHPITHCILVSEILSAFQFLLQSYSVLWFLISSHMFTIPCITCLLYLYRYWFVIIQALRIRSLTKYLTSRKRLDKIRECEDWLHLKLQTFGCNLIWEKFITFWENVFFAMFLWKICERFLRVVVH